METRKIYNRIAILRSDRNLSRVELAEAIGVNFQTIGYLERQDYNPSLDLAFKIGEYFELPLELIFSTEIFASLSTELLKAQEKKGDQNEE